MTPPTPPTPPTPLDPLSEQDLRRALEQAVPEPTPRAGLSDQARGRAGRIRTRRRATVAALAASVVVAVVAIGLPVLTRGDAPVPGSPAASGGPSVGPSQPSAGRSRGQSARQSARQPQTSARQCAENPCTPAEVVAAIRKPLDLPALGPGESCPVSPARRFAAAAGFTGAFDAVGRGPLYFAAGSADVQMSSSQRWRRWLEQKVIWVVDRSYVGGLLLRGRRIDGPGELRFLHYLGAVGYTGGAGDGRRHRELAYVRGGLSSAAAEETSSYPSGIFVDAPGCYAVQVDGVGFSETLVFRAVAP